MAEDKKKKTTKASKSTKAKGMDPSQAQQPGFAIEKCSRGNFWLALAGLVVIKHALT